MVEFFDLLIDGKPVLIPDQDMVMDYTDLDSPETGRDDAGIMHRIILRQNVRKFQLSYSTLTREEYRYLESLFGGKPEFTVTYRDHHGEESTFRAYRSGHSITVRNARTGLYKNYKLTLIEC